MQDKSGKRVSSLRRHVSVVSVASVLPVVALGVAVAGLSGCGIKEKFEQRAAEELSERLIEGAAGGELDVEIDGEKVTVKDKDGNVISANQDGKGKTVITDKDGKTVTAETDEAKGETTVTSSDGTKMVAGQKLPDDIPFTMPALAKVEMGGRIESADNGVIWNGMVISDSKDIDALVAHFKKEFEAKGLSPQVNQRTAPIVGASVTADDKEKGIMAHANLNQVKADDENGGRFLIQFHYQDKNAK